MSLSHPVRRALTGLQHPTPSSLARAAEAAAAWRSHLSRGILPSPPASLGWPPPPLARQWAGTLESLRVPALTRRHPALLDSLMLSLVATVRRYDDAMRHGGSGRPGGAADGGATLPSDGDAASFGETPGALGCALDGAATDDSDAPPADGTADGSCAAALAMQEFITGWALEAEAADAAGTLLDGVGGELSPEASTEGGFRALVASDGWDDLLAAQRALAATPQLRTILRSVGRGGVRGRRGWLSRNLPSKGRTRGVLRSTTPPEDADGLVPGPDLFRCTPLELASLGVAAAALRAPATRRLAEGSLRCREAVGWERERAARRRPAASQLRPSRDAGPLLICLDTSGSMEGPHGSLARAAVLEALRQAQRGKRDAYVLAFGGQGEVQAMPLRASAPALFQLAGFLKGGFGGGTCVEAPLEECIRLVGQQEWAEADILLL